MHFAKFLFNLLPFFFFIASAQADLIFQCPTSSREEAPLGSFLDIHFGHAEQSDQKEEDTFMMSLFSDNVGMYSLFSRDDLTVRLCLESSNPQVIQSLQNPNVVGVIWMSHVKWQKDAVTKKIANAFLVGRDECYIPNSLISAAHPNLQIFGFMGCSESIILNKYVERQLEKIIPTPAILHPPLGAGIPTQDGGLVEIATWPSLPNILFSPLGSILEEAMPCFEEYRIQHPPQKSSKTLSIQFRDLLSRNYGYSVSVNSHLIGVLRAQKDGELGFDANLQKVNLEIPEFALKEENYIVIEPDALDRYRSPLGPKNLIDNILVEDVRLSGLQLLQTPVNLGDADSMGAWDAETGLHFKRNTLLMDAAPPQTTLELRAP